MKGANTYAHPGGGTGSAVGMEAASSLENLGSTVTFTLCQWLTQIPRTL